MGIGVAHGQSVVGIGLPAKGIMASLLSSVRYGVLSLKPFRRMGARSTT
jgi:hypothetical protein